MYIGDKMESYIQYLKENEDIKTSDNTRTKILVSYYISEPDNRITVMYREIKDKDTQALKYKVSAIVYTQTNEKYYKDDFSELCIGKNMFISYIENKLRK